jgi:hypothetical protein
MASNGYPYLKAKPGLMDVEPFKTVLSGNREEMAKLTTPDLEKTLAATLTGMTVALASVVLCWSVGNRSSYIGYILAPDARSLVVTSAAVDRASSGNKAAARRWQSPLAALVDIHDSK